MCNPVGNRAEFLLSHEELVIINDKKFILSDLRTVCGLAYGFRIVIYGAEILLSCDNIILAGQYFDEARQLLPQLDNHFHRSRPFNCLPIDFQPKSDVKIAKTCAL